MSLTQELESLVNLFLKDVLNENRTYNEDFFAEVAELLRLLTEHNFFVQKNMLIKNILDLFIGRAIKLDKDALAFLIYILKYIDSFSWAEKLVAVAQAVRTCENTNGVRLEIYKKFFELIKKAPYYIYDHAVWQIKALKYDERRYFGALLAAHGADSELVEEAFKIIAPEKQHLLTLLFKMGD